MISKRAVRVGGLCVAAAALGLAFGIRAVSGQYIESSGPLAQYSGTALYASMIYGGLLVVWPRLAPLAAAAGALAWCWGVELLQLTDLPRNLSAHSLAARLALGVTFDYVDLLWYPVGVVPLALAHQWLRRR